MNELGITLAWSTVQVTLVLLPVVLVYAAASRRSAVSGAWAASFGLGLVVVLSLWTVVSRNVASVELPGAAASLLAGVTAPPKPDRNTRAASSPSGLMSGHAAPRVEAGRGRGWSLAEWRGVWQRLETSAAAPADRCRPWGTALALICLAGAGIGLLGLGLGLWAVHLCRSRGLAVHDPELIGELDAMRCAMGCLRSVELREVPELTTPATAGWRCAVVFLPADWRSWDERERRAVLAHELAHVRRGDYATGLLARLALVLHAYHPLVHWLAGRHLLEQELAADALAARFAGGKRLYLECLSRLALRQDGRSRSWPARAFLPVRGTLIRRIAMLRDETKVLDRPWSWSRRVPAGLLLLGVAVGVATLRGPARGAGADAPRVARENATPEARPDGARPAAPFDLSWAPEDAMGLVAFRPAAFCRRQGLARFAPALNSGLLSMLKELDVADDPAHSPLRAEAIEQIICSLRVTAVEGQPDYNRRIYLAPIMVRTVEPFDWLAQVRAWWPGLVEVRGAGRVYYRHLERGRKRLVPAECFYFPDDRTIVLDREPNILRLVRRASPTAPAFTRSSAWEHVGDGLIAVALDNHDGQWTSAFKGSRAEDAGLAAAVEHAEHWVVGVADAERLDLQWIATCSSSDAVKTTALAAEALLKLVRAELEQPEPGAPGGAKGDAIREMGTGLLKSIHIAREDRTVTIRSAGSRSIADFISLLAADVTDAGTVDVPAEELQR